MGQIGKSLSAFFLEFPMLRAFAVKAAGSWTQSAHDTVVLDFDDRHRRRFAMKGVKGTEFLLDLEEAVALRSGDALVLDDGRFIEVVGAPEALVEIKPKDTHHAMQIAWHLGNRHLPVQFHGAKIRIRRDHVIEEMLTGLGAKLLWIEAPFDPEGGAYAKASHSHDHGHDHHAHNHHDHSHHEHGPDCGCGHDHHH
jgi:urease accessory protein